ncbi:MAG TPA: sulfate permease, partial [Rhodocyclaceae bacterium]|nr:sulfate permease [Rhodocyclaceae bacterium]
TTNNTRRLDRFLPFLRWRSLVTRAALRDDLLAGFTGALIVLPQGVAFATIAGMPPEYGLYAAMMPAVVAALFGSSWHLVSGPTTAISIALFAAMHHLAEPGTPEYVALALTLTFQVGIFQAALGLARMGALVNFISHTVVIGFTAGAAVLIAASQIRNFFGVQIPRGLPFYEILHQFALQAGNINWLATTVGGITLAAGILTKRYWKKFPYLIAAMLVGSLVAFGLNDWLGQAQTGIRTVGALPAGLPPLSMPDFSWLAIRHTFAPALIITMLALTEAVSIARAIAVRSEQRIDGNQEFIGQGLSNMVGAFFSGYAASGSFNRSGVNYEAGARTPLATIFAAGFLVLVLLVVAPLAAYLPNAAMGGILFLVAWGLIDFHHIESIWRTSKPESAILWVTLLGTLMNLELGIVGGILLSLVMYLYRTSRPAVVPMVPAVAEGAYHFEDAYGKPECPQLRIVRINGSLYFGAVDHIQNALQQIDEDNPWQKSVLVIGSGINFVDVAGAEMLAQEARRRRRLGGGLYFYRLKDSVHRFLRQGDYLKDIGEGGFFPVKSNPARALYWTLDPDLCRRCKTRIFPECHGELLPDGDRRLRLMLATDGSEFAAAPQAIAIGLAQQLGVTLDVLTVAPPAEAKARLEALHRPATAAGVPLEPITRQGHNAAAEVVAAAAAADTHLLVIGRRPAKGIAQKFLGDVAMHIIAEAPCHVLLAPPETAIWQRRILVAYDGSHIADSAAAFATSLAKPGRLPITLLAFAKAGETAPAALREAADHAVGMMKIEGIEGQFRCEAGVPSEVMGRVADEIGADLVVFGGSAGLKGMLQGGAGQLVGACRRPILIVKTGQVGDLRRGAG